MVYALEARGLGKRFGRRWALRNCSLQIPRERVVGLVGLNGVGKTTLMHMAVGLLKPTEGTIEVLGASTLDTASTLPRLGFVSQERSLYRQMTIRDTLTMGKKLNGNWDEALAYALIERLKLSPTQLVGRLSGGQQAQVAVIMALAKKPELLLLDEPFAHVDPLAKREISTILMEMAAEQALTLLISSHSVADLEQICDYLVILGAGQVKVAEEIEQIVREHKLLIGPRESFEGLAKFHTIIQASHVGRQSTALVRTTLPIVDPAWQMQEPSLEDIVLAYLAQQEEAGSWQPSGQLMKEILQ